MVITVSNQKGGVGKTTTSAALAAGFSMAGKKVLCIDLDPQGNLGFCLGLDTEGGSTILDVLKGDISIQKAISRTEGIDILPSDITLSSSGLEYNPGEEKESILKYGKESVKINRDLQGKSSDGGGIQTSWKDSGGPWQCSKRRKYVKRSDRKKYQRIIRRI